MKFKRKSSDYELRSSIDPQARIKIPAYQSRSLKFLKS